MGAVIVATVLVFVIQFNPSAGKKSASLSQVCAARVRGSCIEPKDHKSAFLLVIPRDNSGARDFGRAKALGLPGLVLDGLIERELLVSEAERIGLTVTDAEVDESLVAGTIRISLPADDYERAQRMGIVDGIVWDFQKNRPAVFFHDPKTTDFVDQKAYQREEFARAWRPVGPPVEANTLKELAEGMDMPAENLMDTVANFNAAIQPGEYDLDRLDGKRTLGVTPPKSNWALPLDTPPYIAIPVTGGLTFTFGGVRCDTSARVFDTRGKVMDGLYAAGEPMGEIFYYNYPGASSVIRGAVFGRIAGAHAASRARA